MQMFAEIFIEGGYKTMVPNSFQSPHPFGKEKSFSHPLHSYSPMRCFFTDSGVAKS